MIEGGDNELGRETGSGFVDKNVFFEISSYEDPWMDNGLENFFRMRKDLNSCKGDLTNDPIKMKTLVKLTMCVGG